MYGLLYFLKTALITGGILRIKFLQKSAEVSFVQSLTAAVRVSVLEVYFLGIIPAIYFYVVR